MQRWNVVQQLKSLMIANSVWRQATMNTDDNLTVQFYFDPISPYAWLAARDFPRLQAAGLQIDCKPVLFAGLLNAHGQKGPAEIPAKRVYTFYDVVRTAHRAATRLPVSGAAQPSFQPLTPLAGLHRAFGQAGTPAFELRIVAGVLGTRRGFE
jgi:2-hydroxychromene-2-carboxylate isomerase